MVGGGGGFGVLAAPEGPEIRAGGPGFRAPEGPGNPGPGGAGNPGPGGAGNPGPKGRKSGPPAEAGPRGLPLFFPFHLFPRFFYLFFPLFPPVFSLFQVSNPRRSRILFRGAV